MQYQTSTNGSLTHTQKLTISGMVMALYIVIVGATQGISFGAYQIRIATSLYALGWLYPFLVIPLGLANMLSNVLFGGLGPLDMIGGGLVGVATTFLITVIRKKKGNVWLAALPIFLIPGLVVPIWLSVLLNIPYPPLAFSVSVGQIIPAICGVFLIRILSRIVSRKEILV
ncbi:MAG: QueT transporter family protein [Lachnospiraceae bacterium]|nr:QueT transporter family protein [Robinsoniella sp.]MDY3766933.1 QueT transporter family protein [Lachnospiraceae bacterium]